PKYANWFASARPPGRRPMTQSAHLRQRPNLMPVDTLDNIAAEVISAGWIAPDQLEAARKKAQADGKPLEDTLVAMRLLLDSQLAVLRAKRLGFAYCDLSSFIPNLQNANLVPEEVVRRHVMFPLFVLDGLVTLVMADP